MSEIFDSLDDSSREKFSIFLFRSIKNRIERDITLAVWGKIRLDFESVRRRDERFLIFLIKVLKGHVKRMLTLEILEGKQTVVIGGRLMELIEICKFMRLVKHFS